MKISKSWTTAAILALPFAWVIAFLLFLRPLLLSDSVFIFPIILGLVLGLIIGGIITDRHRRKTFILLLIDSILLVIGIVQWILPPDFWLTPSGLLFLSFFLFLFGYALVLLTVFLNQLVSSVHRGHIVGILTVLTIFTGGVFSFFWRFPIPTSFAPAITAGLILLVLLITFFVQPWKEELVTYMVPGSIRPYAIWWVIYLVAFGLYMWATPLHYRYLLTSFFLYAPSQFNAEVVLIGLAGATFVFTFLPDKLGRKLVFNIATLLLGLLCIFGGAQLDDIIGFSVSLWLSILQAFVIAFIISVGAWLVWAEIGSVRMKGRRAAFGWMLLGLLVAVFWYFLVTGSYSETPLLVYPIAATLVLISIFPLTNAREVVWNERVIEDIEITVDSRKVSRALRDLEFDTALRSIEGQIESEIKALAKIKGVTKKRARLLRDSGYETLDLVARADVDLLAQLLSIQQTKAKKIIANAKTLHEKTSTSAPKSSKTKKTK